MESENNAETLKEGFLESKPSKDEIFSSEICEDGNPGCLSNLSEKSVVDAFSGRDGLTNVELARLFSDGSFVDSILFDDISGNNGMNEGPVNGYSDEKLAVSTQGYDLCSNDFPVFEGELKFNGNGEDQTAKVEEPVGKFDEILNCDELFHNEKIGMPMEKGNDVLHPHDLCSNDFPVFEEELKFSGNDGDQTAKVEEPVGKFDDILNCDELFHDEKIGMPMEKDNDVLHPHDLCSNDFPVFEGELKFSGNDGDQTAKVEEPVGKFDEILNCDELFHDEKIGMPMAKGNDVLHPHDLCSNDNPGFEGELKFSGNDGDQTAKVEEPVGKFDDILNCDEPFHDEKIGMPMVKGNDVLHPHDPGSPTKLEVSGNNINLFVDVFGPLDGISGSDDDLDCPVECKSEEIDTKQEFSHEEKGTVSTGVTDLRVKCEGEDIIGEQGRTFDCGDLVWIKTRTHSWWPGMVTGPYNVLIDSYLVKYFGNGYILWCVKADLKPFCEYLEQMSQQNNSRNFFASIDKALCEIGQRVKLTMTCPCFSKGSEPLDAQLFVRNKEENSMSTQKVSKFDGLSLSQFQPATFIADIRGLARSMHVPCKVEFMIMKNRLSPFYRSIGHRELPLQLLRSGSDAAQNAYLGSDIRDGNHNNIFGDGRDSVKAHDGKLTRTRGKKRKNHGDGSVIDDKITSSAKSLDSRERKKSKYLSYPYIDVIKGQEKEDPKQRGAKKPFKEHHIVSKADDISACSVDLLAELCSTARDCSYINRSKYSGSLKRFYCSFRLFGFLDADIASKVAGDQAAAEEQMEGSRVVKKSKKQRANLASVEENDEGDKSSVVGNQDAKENVVCRRAKKKEQMTNSEVPMEGIRVVKESENQKVNLASGSFENADKFPRIENLQAKELGVCGNTHKEKEKGIPVGLECMQSSFGMLNINAKSSWMISFQQACSNLFKRSNIPQKSAVLTPGLADTIPISHTPPGPADKNPISHTPPGLADKNPISDTPPGIADKNPISHTPPGIANKYPISHTPPGIADTNPIFHTPPGFPVDHIPVGVPTANLVNPLPEQRNEGLASPTINGIQQMYSASLLSPKVEPVTFPNTPLSNNGVSGAYQCLNGDFTTRPPVAPTTMNKGLSSIQMANFLSAATPEPRKRKRKEKTCQVAPGIPDLNGNVLDMMSPPGIPTPMGSHIPPEGEPQKKRRYRSAGSESDAPPGGSLLLNFAPGCVPSREILVATFSRFGLLKESELEVLSDDNVKIVYERSSEARFASRSLEKSHTFGESLINFKLDCFIPDPPKVKKKNSLQLQTFVPVGTFKNQTKLGEAPNIASIKQKVEMMKSTLEKAGNNLSPETRAMLEKEIKSFLDKLSSVAGSSSL